MRRTGKNEAHGLASGGGEDGLLTLCNVAGVAQVDHQLIKCLRNLIHPKARLLGGRREAIAWQ